MDFPPLNLKGGSIEQPRAGPMTARQAMRRRVFRAKVAFVLGIPGGIALILGSTALTVYLDPPMHSRLEGLVTCIFFAGCLCGVTLMVGGLLYAGQAIRCPWCGNAWAMLMLNHPGLEAVRCCPYCEKLLDEEMPAKGKSGKGKSWEDEIA